MHAPGKEDMKRKIKIAIITVTMFCLMAQPYLALGNTVADEEKIEEIKSLYCEDVTGEREEFLEEAYSCVDKLLYRLGADNENYADCSSFVGRCYDKATGEMCKRNTRGFTDSVNAKEITFEEILPGDVALVKKPGASSNHIVIYAGRDKNNVDYFIGNSSKAGGVVVDDYNNYNYFYRIF